MPFLAGGYHLPFASKVALTNTSFLLMAAELLDEEEGWADNWEDTGAILQFAGTAYVLWIPPVVQAGIAARVGVVLTPLAVPAAIVTSVIIVGGIVTYFVDPDEGLQNYKDFLLEPTKIPKRVKFAAKKIYEVKVEPRVNVGIGIGKMVYDMAQREAEQKLNTIQSGMQGAGDWIERNNPFLTGPYLPF